MSLFEFDITPGYLIPTRRRTRWPCRLTWAGFGFLLGFAVTGTFWVWS